MKEYMHNGVKVIFQTLQDESFLDYLNKEGIKPEELPDKDLRYRVFYYIKDNQEKYACITTGNAPDVYTEKIYLTTEYPIDGFFNLIKDVDDQIKGENPHNISSRLKTAVMQAEKDAKDWIEKQYPEKVKEWFFSGYPKEIKKEFKAMQKLALISYGYDLETLDKITVSDVDIHSIKDILK